MGFLTSLSYFKSNFIDRSFFSFILKTQITSIPFFFFLFCLVHLFYFILVHLLLHVTFWFWIHGAPGHKSISLSCFSMAGPCFNVQSLIWEESPETRFLSADAGDLTSFLPSLLKVRRLQGLPLHFLKDDSF